MNPPADQGAAEFAYSPHVHVGSLSGYSGFLSQSKDTQVNRLIGDSKLSIGVNVSVNGCLSLCVSPVIVWRPVQGVLRLSHSISWDRLQPPSDC